MTFTHQQQILYKEFLDEYIGEHTLDNFIEWCKYEMADVSKPDVAQVGGNQVDTPNEYLTMRLDAYYYGFERTGVIEIDRILSAVATAGKHYHHTEDWGEEEEQAIQNAANAAAKAFTARTDLQPSDPEATTKVNSEAQEYDPNTPTRPVDTRKCFKCLKGEGHNG